MWMDIAALSMVLSLGKLKQQAGVSLLKLAMEKATVQTDTLSAMLAENTKIMEQSMTPHLGQTIDIRL